MKTVIKGKQSERQAAFLGTVMLHAGVCLGPHYRTFARIAYGQKMHEFFGTLIDRGYARRSWRWGHDTARLYHVHHKPLDVAIGDPASHRKPTPRARAVERLMVLDAVLAARDTEWLGRRSRNVPGEREVPHLVLLGVPSVIEEFRWYFEAVADKFRRGQGWQTVRNAWVLLSAILETAVAYGSSRRILGGA